MRYPILMATAVAALSAGAAQAAPGAHRAWVSGHGVDQAGCGAPAAPCRSLQYAHDNVVAAGGEIDILDPAGYGAINITKAISIVNDGVGTAGVQATGGQWAITVNAGATDAVYLKGLNVDGVQQTGQFGVVLNTAGSLAIDNCVIQHFSADAITLGPSNATANVRISNTVTSFNRAGISYFANGGVVNAVVDHVTASNNGNGLFLAGEDEVATGVATFVVSNSIVSNNTNQGVWVSSGATNSVWAALDNSISSENGNDGLLVQTSATVHLSRSVLDKNGAFGVENETSSPGQLFSSRDSHLDDNSSGPVGGPAPTTDMLH
jgi:hypothetical protein